MEVGYQSADIIDGKVFAANLRERIGRTVEVLRQDTGMVPGLPGGVGPMTIACLLLNTVFAFCDQRGFVRPAELVV